MQDTNDATAGGVVGMLNGPRCRFWFAAKKKKKEPKKKKK